VQLIPVIAATSTSSSSSSGHPPYTLPWSVRALEPGELDEMKGHYGEIREAQRRSGGCVTAERVLGVDRDAERPPIKSASARREAARGRRRGIVGALSWATSSSTSRPTGWPPRFYGEAIARIVKDPETRPPWCQPPVRLQAAIIGPGLLRDVSTGTNVTLVDLRKARSVR